MSKRFPDAIKQPKIKRNELNQLTGRRLDYHESMSDPIRIAYALHCDMRQKDKY